MSSQIAVTTNTKLQGVIMYLTDHFSYEEVIASETAERKGIDNTLPVALNTTVDHTATAMERVRALLGNVPLHVNSWYRCHLLNQAVGSKDTSQHTKGEAVDFICPLFGTPKDICEKIIANKELIRFDQLIWEHTWVHISFVADDSKARGNVLTLMPGNTYATGIVEK